MKLGVLAVDKPKLLNGPDKARLHENAGEGQEDGVQRDNNHRTTILKTEGD